MGALKLVPGPRRMIKTCGANLPETVRRVTSRTTRVPVHHLRQMRLVELALVNIIVTVDTRGRCAMKDTWQIGRVR